MPAFGRPRACERLRGAATSALALARIDDVDVQGRVAIVRLGPSLGNGRTDQVDGIGQVVLTLIADPQIDAVQFQQNGQPLPVPTSEGALVSRPLSIADYQQLTT
ncbi:MAG: GerMN domain-containing protein [Actinobacteria bacterium]|nr:GerMN domain-containing protein [Actinomycetota bacterium]